MANITVVGAGLAGAECAWQLCRRGHAVTLREMKPEKRSPAHQRDSFAELVCSNSLRSDRLENAVGLLKEEMRSLDSLIMACADETRVPAGGALAVDREGFTELVTRRLLALENLTYVPGEVMDIPDTPCVIATGPLTSGALYERISELVGRPLHFYDAAAPIVTKESLDHTKVFAASRYGRGEDYLNCPMTRDEYFAFYHALVTAQTTELHSFETPRVFEGCMPVEVMAKRGEMTLAYGPLKPVGLKVDGRMPFAVVQLRQDDKDGRLYKGHYASGSAAYTYEKGRIWAGHYTSGSAAFSYDRDHLWRGHYTSGSAIATWDSRDEIPDGVLAFIASQLVD